MIYGLLVWPIGFLLILLTKEAKKTYSVLWGLAGCLTYATFFIFIPWYPQSSHPPTISYIIEHPLLGIQYFISNIGSPFASTYPEAFYFGIILILGLICISIILIKYQHLQENGIWIAIILYSFGFSLMATIGRAGFGDIEYLLTSRYVGTTVIGVIGLYLLTLSVQRTFLAKKIIHSIVFLALVIGIIVFGVYAGYGNGLKYGAIWSANQQDGANALLYYKVATDEELRLITPAPDDVREKAKFLEANNLSVFHPDAKKAPYLNTHKKMLANPIYVNTYPGQPISSIYGIIDFKSKKVLLQQPFQMDQNPAIIQFNNVSVSNNSSLSFSIAMSPEVWSPEQGDGATFNVYVNVVNPENLIFSHYIDPKNNPADRRWNNYNVSLSKYAGQNISLVFSTLPGPNNNPAWDSAWWGEPSVVESKI